MSRDCCPAWGRIHARLGPRHTSGFTRLKIIKILILNLVFWVIRQVYLHKCIGAISIFHFRLLLNLRAIARNILLKRNNNKIKSHLKTFLNYCVSIVEWFPWWIWAVVWSCEWRRQLVDSFWNDIFMYAFVFFIVKMSRRYRWIISTVNLGRCLKLWMK